MERGLELTSIEARAKMYDLEEFRRTRRAAYETEALQGYTEHELIKEKKSARFMDIEVSKALAKPKVLVRHTVFQGR